MHTNRKNRALKIALLSTLSVVVTNAQPPAESLPNPYRVIENWAKLPGGRAWGSAASIAIDHHGHLWVFERCGGDSCAGRTEPPILEFDQSGKLIKSFGAGMFVFPHAIFVDKDDNVWVTDADGKDGKGQQVMKFSSKGKLLLTLGKAGVAAIGPDTFDRPSGVVVAPNGDIFVADGHEGVDNARVVKFSKDGNSSRLGGKRAALPESLATLTRSQWTRGDESWSPIAEIAEFRFSIRTGITLSNGRNSATPAEFTSTTRTQCTSPTTLPAMSQSAAFVSGAPRTVR